MAARKSEAEWRGTVKEGAGIVTLGSGAFSGGYSFASRFDDASGTNPEELLGAAHAACFSMALSLALGTAGFTPRLIRTTAIVHISAAANGFSIPRIDLATEGDVPGIDLPTFETHAELARRGCPVSKALAGVEITLKASLAG